MRRRPRGDQGVAALELALVLTVLLAVTGLVLPLPLALLEKTRLEQAAGRTVRWATAVRDGDRPLPPDTAGNEGRRDELVTAEAERALEVVGARAVLVDALVRDEPAAHCPLRRSRTVQLTSEVDLGALAVLVDAVRPGPATDTLTITARANACEE